MTIASLLQIDADGLPHATPFAVEGLSRPVVRTASDARAMFARAIERCEARCRPSPRAHGHVV